MELRQLKYFIEIADGGSICEGARRLNMSQPPLSYQMKLLETELGVQLFERKQQGITLTEAGRLFYTRASKILQITWNTAQEMESLKENKTLRLGLTSTSGPAVMNKIKAYHQASPNVRFEVHDNITFQLLESLKKDQLDVAVVRSPAPLEGIRTHLITTEPMIVAATKNHLPKQAAISLKDLEEKPLIFHRRYSRLILDAFHRQNLSAKVICECDDARTSLLWADTGMGIALFPQSMTPLSGSLIINQITEPDLHTKIYLAWLKDKELSSPAKEFIEFFQQSSMAVSPGNGSIGRRW